MNAQRPRTFLPHIFGILYGVAIAYASLQPFAPWIPPAPGTPFWPLAPWPPKWTRFDVIANALAYVPFGMFAALTPRRASPLVRTGVALAAGVTLSFSMETLQMFLPSRAASLVDLFANAGGAVVGGLLGGMLVRAERLRRLLSGARAHAFIEGRLGDTGIALLALWLTAQINPGIPLFAVNFEPGLSTAVAAPAPDIAATMLEAAQSAFQLAGVGLFLALLLRERRSRRRRRTAADRARFHAEGAGRMDAAQACRMGGVAEAGRGDRHRRRFARRCCWRRSCRVLPRWPRARLRCCRRCSCLSPRPTPPR